MKIAIIGTTGLIGEHVLQILSSDKRVKKIHALGRRRPDASPNTLQFHKLELVDLPHAPALDADHWICALGTTIKKAGSPENFKKVDLDAVVEFAKLAERSGAKSLHVVSAVSANKDSAVFYNKTKGQMEDQVGKLKIQSIHFYRPSLLLGNRREFRLGEKIAICLAPLYSPLLIGPLAKYRPIEAYQVAEQICSRVFSDDLNPEAGTHF